MCVFVGVTVSVGVEVAVGRTVTVGKVVTVGKAVAVDEGSDVAVGGGIATEVQEIVEAKRIIVPASVCHFIFYLTGFVLVKRELGETLASRNVVDVKREDLGGFPPCSNPRLA